MKKEALSVMTVKIILAIIIFAVSVVIINEGILYFSKGVRPIQEEAKRKATENKITWIIYNSSEKSLFNWEKYSLEYPSSWNYAEERILSSRKTGALKTVFMDSDKQLDKLSIIVGGEKSNKLLIQSVSEVKFSNNIFYKYNDNDIENRQVYYIYKTGTNKEINLGMEEEIIFEFNNTNENVIIEILESFDLSSSIKIEEDTSNWQTYRNEEFGFEFKYPEEEINIILQDKDRIYLENKSGEKFVLSFLLFENIKEYAETPSPGQHYAKITYDNWVYILNSKENKSCSQNLKEHIHRNMTGDIYEGECLITHKNNYIKLELEKEIHYYTPTTWLIFSNIFNEDIFNQILSSFKFIEN